MSDYAILGKKGAGKSLVTVSRIRMFLLEGRSVATNLDLFLDKLMPIQSKATALRLPDFPTGADLWAIGEGGSSPDEESFGLLALDELAVFLNSRQWRDDKRQEVISFLRHSRKLRWHTYLLSQGLKSIDSQIREDCIDHVVTLRRTDKIPIPVIGKLLRMANFTGKFFRLHIGFVKYGTAHNSLDVDRWYVLANDKLQSGYDTEQIFEIEPKYETRQYPRYTPTPYGMATYSTYEQKIHLAGTFSYLSAWHLKGRYIPFHQKYRYHAIIAAGAISLIFGLFTGHDVVKKNDLKTTFSSIKNTAAQIAQTKKAKGVINNGVYNVLIMRDGSMQYSTESLEYLDTNGNKKTKYNIKGDYYEVDN